MRQFSVNFRVVDDHEQPLAGAQISAGGEHLGSTNERGTLHRRLSGREGEELVVKITCPVGHDEPQDLPLLKLQQLLELDKKLSESHYTARCTAARRTVALVIHSRGHGQLPIFVNGSFYGKTDTTGLAHYVYQLAPNNTLRVKLDTSERPDLRPQSPLRTFAVTNRDMIVLFDQTFKTSAKHSIVRRRAPRKEAPREVPYRVE